MAGANSDLCASLRDACRPLGVLPLEAAEASLRVSGERDEVSEKLAGVAVVGASRHLSAVVGGIAFESETFFEVEERDTLAVASAELRRELRRSTLTAVMDETSDVCGTARGLSSGAQEGERRRVAVEGKEVGGAAAGGCAAIDGMVCLAFETSSGPRAAGCTAVCWVLKLSGGGLSGMGTWAESGWLLVEAISSSFLDALAVLTLSVEGSRRPPKELVVPLSRTEPGKWPNTGAYGLIGAAIRGAITV